MNIDKTCRNIQPYTEDEINQTAEKDKDAHMVIMNVVGVALKWSVGTKAQQGNLNRF